MNDNSEFYTLKGYDKNRDTSLTYAMEDYLEMICRILKSKNSVRIRDLSTLLNVRPSSATKMIQHLTDGGYIDSKKYGEIRLTEKGSEYGSYLLYRHDVVRTFLETLNQTENELEQTEKIEHFLNRQTVENLDFLTKNIKK